MKRVIVLPKDLIQGLLNFDLERFVLTYKMVPYSCKSFCDTITPSAESIMC